MDRLLHARAQAWAMHRAIGPSTLCLNSTSFKNGGPCHDWTVPKFELLGANTSVLLYYIFNPIKAKPCNFCGGSLAIISCWHQLLYEHHFPAMVVGLLKWWNPQSFWAIYWAPLPVLVQYVQIVHHPHLYPRTACSLLCWFSSLCNLLFLGLFLFCHQLNQICINVFPFNLFYNIIDSVFLHRWVL